MFPHLIDQILGDCETAALFALRESSQDLHYAVDRRIYEHVVVGPTDMERAWVGRHVKNESVTNWLWGGGGESLPAIGGQRLCEALSWTRMLTIMSTTGSLHPHLAASLRRLHTVRLVSTPEGPCWPPAPLIAAPRLTVIGWLGQWSFVAVPPIPEPVSELVVAIYYSPKRYVSWGGSVEPLVLPTTLKRLTFIFTPGTDLMVGPAPVEPPNIVRGLLNAMLPYLSDVECTLVDPPASPTSEVFGTVVRDDHETAPIAAYPPENEHEGADTAMPAAEVDTNMDIPDADVKAEAGIDNEAEKQEQELELELEQEPSARELADKATALRYTNIQRFTSELLVQSGMNRERAEATTGKHLKVVTLGAYRAQVGEREYEMQTKETTLL
jgi:hypothetical protein